MAITQFTTTPLSTDPTNFSSRMDTRILEQQRFVTEANDLALEMNLYSTYGAGAALAPSGFKNKIIGGDFTTNPWQRGTSFAAVINGQLTADRWIYAKVGTAVHTITKSVDAPTASQAGIFTQHSLAAAVTTAQATIALGDVFNLQQRVEGFNGAPFGFGQAGARNVTVSFWVKGAKTGIHCVSICNSVADRSYVAEYTINVINTWEKKVITIPVDTAGTWLYDSGTALTLRFALAAGSSAQTTANTWTAGNFIATSSQVNELDTIGNTFKIALVQLEQGSTATNFESRSIGQELSLCQRYYSSGILAGTEGGASTGQALTANVYFPAVMRTTPSITLSNQSLSTIGSVSVINQSINGFNIRGLGSNATVVNSAFTTSWQSASEL